MRNRTTLMFAIPALLIATACPQLALAQHKIITFDPPGAGTAAGQGTFAQMNLNSGAVVGYYIDANGVSHGFIRSAHGKYTIIDVPGATGTQAFGINEEGTVVGWWFEKNGVYHGYLRDDHGNFTSFDVPGAGPAPPQGFFPAVIVPLPQAINRSGTVSGTYVDGNNPPMFHCFVRSPDGNITSFDPAGSVNTLGDTEGITRAGAIAGGYFTSDGVIHGFVRDPEGAITSFDAPGAGTIVGPNPLNLLTGTAPNTINDAGVMPGEAFDNNHVQHGFIRNSDGTFVTFDVTGAGTSPGQGTYAEGTNLSGTTAGNYIDANGVAHGFVRSRHGRITTYDVPGAGTSSGQGTVFAYAINAEGAIVGWYVDANGAYHGYIYQSEDEDD